LTRASRCSLMNVMSTTPARGAAGKFISKEQAENITSEDLPELVSKSSKMTGALKKLKEEKENAELDKPLVSVSVNNPFSWLLKWINYLRKKQTTTFTFRMGVPLIALPILIAAFATVFFGLGKITSPKQDTVVEKPTSYLLSKTGTLKNISEQGEPVYYLILTDGSAIKLEVPASVDLSKLEGKRILVFGNYVVSTNTVTVDKVADMEILPVLPKPLPTLSTTPTPTTTPEASPSGATLTQ
jgi:hypothetical protein